MVWYIMIKTNLFEETGDRKIVQKKGCFSVLEYSHDVSVSMNTAISSYYASKVGVRKRHVIAELDGNAVILQSGLMQWFAGDIDVQVTAKGKTDMLKKMVGSRVTGEASVKPKFSGSGIVVLEPTYKYVLLEDISDWGGALIMDDSLFLACEDSLDMNVSSRSSLSSSVMSGEGQFSTSLSGNGVAAIRCPVPREELIVIELENDALRIDGNFAIAWTPGLQFSVERTVGNIVNSTASGEGTVNVFRGTGKVLMAPACGSIGMAAP